jgi:hypothetical protein
MELLNRHLMNPMIAVKTVPTLKKIVVQLEVLKVNQLGMIFHVAVIYMVSSKLINAVLELTHSSKWRLIQMRTRQ